MLVQQLEYNEFNKFYMSVVLNNNKILRTLLFLIVK